MSTTLAITAARIDAEIVVTLLPACGDVSRRRAAPIARSLTTRGRHVKFLFETSSLTTPGSVTYTYAQV